MVLSAMCVCTCVFTCVCSHVYAQLYCTHVCTRVLNIVILCVCACVYAHVCVCVCACVCVCMLVHAEVCTYHIYQNSFRERAQIEPLRLVCASENELELNLPRVGRTQRERKAGTVNVLHRTDPHLRFRATVGDTLYERWQP